MYRVPEESSAVWGRVALQQRCKSTVYPRLAEEELPLHLAALRAGQIFEWQFKLCGPIGFAGKSPTETLRKCLNMIDLIWVRFDLESYSGIQDTYALSKYGFNSLI